MPPVTKVTYGVLVLQKNYGYQQLIIPGVSNKEADKQCWIFYDGTDWQKNTELLKEFVKNMSLTLTKFVIKSDYVKDNSTAIMVLKTSLQESSHNKFVGHTKPWMAYA